MDDVTLNARGNDSFSKFLEMLAWIDICSNLGINSKFTVEYYGDCSSKIDIDILENKDEYESIRERLLEDYLSSNFNQPYLFRI